MLAVAGYFDGVAVRPLEDMQAKPNQRVIITVMEDFIVPSEKVNPKSKFLSLAGNIDIDRDAVNDLRDGSKL